jgi:serine phosphatase RsbU (regulator of sigma subunit)
MNLGRDATLATLLDAAEDASPVQAVESVTQALRERLDAQAVSFLIADLSGRALVRLAHASTAAITSNSSDGTRHDDADSAQALPFDGGTAEQALRTQTVQVIPPLATGSAGSTEALWTVLAPVTERGEALGLLEMYLPAEPAPSVLEEIVRTAHVLAFVVIANRRHTDLYEWGQRSTPFSLPAEIQRRLLPSSFTCEGGAFTLAAWLEPAASVGGDTFDYSLGRDALHLSITDAMGHGVASALIATLCVGSLRNSRQLGASLLEQATAANNALLEHSDSIAVEGFVTGVLGRLDLTTGSLMIVNAGHVEPFLLRAGTVTRVPLTAGLPLGLFSDAAYLFSELQLLEGDRLVFVTDGMLERNAATLDLVAEIEKTTTLHPREVARLLADQVVGISGVALLDDATLLVLDWHGKHGKPGSARVTNAGADLTETA